MNATVAAEHTKGSWRANDLPQAPEPEFRHATAVWAERVAADGGEPINILVCSVHPDLFHDWQPKAEERTANAKLIAAAPDMLEALEVAIFILNDFTDGYYSHKDADALRTKLRDIRNKAKGLAPNGPVFF